MDPNICFRADDLQKARDLINLEESFNVTGVQGVGKSRFLRHLTYQSSFSKSLNKNVKICYIDLRNYSGSLFNSLNAEISKYEISSVNNLDDVFIQFNTLYLILDESMELLKYDVEEINKLRALRDRYKYQLNFIFAYNEKTEMSYSQKSLFEIAKYTVGLKPLNKSDMKATIKYLSNGYEFELKKKEINEIIKEANGFPGKTRGLILGKILGEVEQNSRIILDREKLLENALYYLTKNEYLIFKAMLEKQNYFIEKDEIAEIISPESEGVGVSDSAIAQIIRRLRKKLSLNNAHIKIKTKRGFGYMLD